MKKINLIATLLMAASSFGQLSNNVPTYGPVSIGTETPVTGKQLTVNGNAQFTSTVELNGDIFIEGQTVMRSIVRMDALATYAGLPEDMEILIRDPYGVVTRTTRSTLMAALMNPVGLDYCGDGDIATPQWFTGLNKIFSPCPEVKVGIGTDNPSHQLSVPVGTTFVKKFLAGNSLGSTDAAINGFVINHSQKLIQLGKKIGALTEEVRFSIDNDGAVTVNNVGDSPSLTINNGTGHAVVIKNNDGDKIVQIQNNGLIRSRRIKVDNEEWADYVFAKDYNLLSLKETETYIKRHGHLPNIPSAEEIASNGLDIGEMQKLQMEKIEELTLHLIEMDKRISALQNENEDLKTEIKKLKK